MPDRDKPLPPIKPVRPLQLEPEEAPPVPPAPLQSEDLELPRLQLGEAALSQISSPALRDRIVVLGRRGSGKTIYLARLYEALWQGATLAGGYLLRGNESAAGRSTTRISCRTTAGSAHTRFMQTVQDLKAGRWPGATSGSSYAELIVSHDGREHIVTAIDYPGEVFRKAFMLDSEEPDAVELRSAVDRAAAAILLIDPNVVASGGPLAEEDTFGLTHAALRIRRSHGGHAIPIALVFTKTDENAALLREAGGVKQFAARHFGPLLREIDRTSVFACAAVRSTQNALGRAIPRTDKPPENVVEPLHYCLEYIETSEDVERSRAAKAARREALRKAADAEHQERKKSAMAWVVFGVSIAMLLTAVAIAAFWFAMKK
ncbi:MAG: Double-GTPase 2 [Planctomycetota bacterium]